METNTENETQKAEFRLRQIYFYLTEGCNLKCRHCWIAPKYQAPDKPLSALSLNLFRSIIGQAKPLGLTEVKLTGGEPLLHPQIHAILEVIHADGLGLTLETNGVLCTPELAEKIKATSEKPFVSVSLDGADAQTHEWVRGVAGSFEDALAGIRNLVEAGVKPQIIMSVMRRNKNQLEAVVRLAERIGVGSVKFNPVMPTARGEKLHDVMETLSLPELVELGEWVDNSLSASTELRLIYHQPPAFKPLSRIFGNNGDGCGRCGILGILGVLSDGAYALCGIGEAVPDLVFGHAGQDRLEDVWHHTGVLNELRKGLPKRLQGICGDCLMRGICLGSCIAQNYYSNQDLWAPFWYCREANKAGLFPITRLRPKIE